MSGLKGESDPPPEMATATVSTHPTGNAFLFTQVFSSKECGLFFFHNCH